MGFIPTLGTGPNPSTALQTVASYANLPSNPTTGLGVFITDRGAVYQWDGAAWGLLGVVNVDEVADLPATGNTTGDLAVTSTPDGLYEWDGADWVQQGAPYPAPTPSASTLDLAAEASGTITWSQSEGVGAVDFSLSGIDSGKITASPDPLAIVSGSDGTLTVTRLITSSLTATVSYTTHDRGTGSISVEADAVTALRVYAKMLGFKHIWAFTSGSPTADSGTGGATLTFNSVSRSASTFTGAEGKITIDAISGDNATATFLASRSADRTVVWLFGVDTYATTRCIAQFGAYSTDNTASGSLGWLAINGSNNLVWQLPDLTTALTARTGISGVVSTGVAQMVIIRYDHGGTSKIDHNYTSGSRNTASGSVASGAEGSSQGGFGSISGTYNDVLHTAHFGAVFDGYLTDDQVTEFFTLAGMT